ncbi:Spy/CpxP family protein refolding chaperone [Microbulbifer aggregans]|uniref:Spy/CpxP family protein refolding chaperone n=1 Tax=Microbulbifer aggregans TaxID=1769779 RepID=UPI001CFE9E98|nr:Spy/CpxP family protein refolding chaperone [Microbulbifer aggregans]
MKMWKALAGSAILSGALAAPGMVMAFPDDDHGPRHHKHRMFEHMADELDLTEGQRAQLKANREANKESHKAARQEMHEVRKQLMEAIDSGADQATLDSLGAKLGQLEVSKMQRMHEQRVQFESILTDEQKAKLEELKAKREEHREKREQRWKERDQ